jgi:Ca-activated chloride channel family protein
MADAARAAGGGLTVVTVDDRDVEELAGRIRRSVSRAAAREGERWRDGGYALVPLLTVIVLVWFRRGWKLGNW